MTPTKNAHFLQRLLANSIDNSLFLAINVWFLLQMTQAPSIAQLLYWLVIFLIVLLSPLGILYPIVFPALFQATIGKMIAGLKITAESGQKLGFKKLLFRQTIGYIFSTVFFGLGYLSVLKDSNRQAWHDKVVGSAVQKTSFPWFVGLLTLLLLIGFNSYQIFQGYYSALANEPLKNEILTDYYQYKTALDLAKNGPKITSGVSIDATPSATILIDDKEVGQTPYQNEDITEGEHKIMLKSDQKNTTPWEGQVPIFKGTITNLGRDLHNDVLAGEITTLEQGKGLKVTSNPAEASVELDGKNVGKTPLTLEDTPKGEHKVVLMKPGSLGRQITIVVVDNYQTHLAMDLGRDKTPSTPTQKPATLYSYTQQDVDFWKGELDWNNEQLNNLQTWKNSNKDQAKVDRLIAIENQQKNISSTLYNKMLKKELLTAAENALPAQYDKLSYEYGTLLKEVLGS